MIKKTYRNLTEDDKKHLLLTYREENRSFDDRLLELANHFQVSSRTIRNWVRWLGFTNHTDTDNAWIRQGVSRDYTSAGKTRFIITWAQNAAPPHKPFWENILAYAEHIDAEVGVILGRYRNPTSQWTLKNQEHEYWWTGFKPYSDAARHNIHRRVDIASDLKIQPTAVNPLQGLHGISGPRSLIVGHPKVHMKTMPTLEGHQDKYMMTTGAVTIRDYTDSKAGKKAEFHHTFGFVILELDGDSYHMRQVTADEVDGSFHDLFYFVENGNVTMSKECEAVIMGDIHVRQLDEELIFNTEYLLFNNLKPRTLVFQDVLDGESISPHEYDNPISQFAKYREGRLGVKNEIEEAINWIEKWAEKGYEIVVPYANHHIWPDRWILKYDWKKNVIDSLAYLEYAQILMDKNPEKGLFGYLLDERLKSKGVMAMGPNDSHMVYGWEVSQHGHLGSKGSKGSLQQMRKLATKIVVGDYHSPGRMDSAMSAGTCTKKRLSYNKGPSDWAHAHVIIHKNGKAQHVIFDENYRFTTMAIYG